MALQALPALSNVSLSIAFLSIAIVATAVLFAFKRPSLPKNAPPLVAEAWPIIGSMQFFTDRWGFFQRQMAHSPTGNFSFYAGDKIVVGMSGDESRRIFFDNKHLGLGEGYGGLLGGNPKITKNNKNLNPLTDLEDREDQTEGYTNYFAKRIIAILKGGVLARGLPQLLKDVRIRIDNLANQEVKSTDPFDSIYRTVFQVTMRTIACVEIANDPVMLEKCLGLFETIEGTATPLSIMYAWMPLPSKFRRTYAGAQLYMIFKNIIDARAREGRKEDDALQYLIDQGDDVTKIITFVLGALFAGQLNSGINAAWITMYLSDNPQWAELAREEVEAVATRYCPDKSIPLLDRLMKVPIEAWESEFPTIDLMLRESIRLQLPGAAFRRNMSGRPIPINKAGTEVIPADGYAACQTADIHQNPAIYTDPTKFDPGRFLPGREEDKKATYGYIGWGVGRHPCLGMRFAKLENNVITAFFVAAFEIEDLVDSKGMKTELPEVDMNAHSAHKPEKKVFVNYKVRQQ